MSFFITITKKAIRNKMIAMNFKTFTIKVLIFISQTNKK